MNRLLNWLGRWLCSYEIHRVSLFQRHYADELEGGYQGPCVRCGAWTVSDR